jgi:hypothetical protein
LDKTYIDLHEPELDNDIEVWPEYEEISNIFE